MIRKLRVNLHMGKYTKGQIISVECDSRGVPLDRFWRRRVKDSEIDNCVTFLPEESQAKKKGGNK